MKTLKWMTLVAITFATSLSVNAQAGQQRHRQMPDSAQMEKRMDKMVQELELTDTQKEEFETLLVEHKKEVKDAKDKHKPEREKQRAEMEEIRKSFDADVAKILTPEQQTEYEALKKQQMEQRKGNKDCPCCGTKGKGKGKGKELQE